MTEKNRLRALKAWKTRREKKELGAIGSFGMLTYLKALESADHTSSIVQSLAGYYRTPELLKLAKSFRKDLDELERIGVKMGMIEIKKNAR